MPNLARASQKLVAAGTLIPTMPEPSTLEGRNLRREAQALIEQAAMQQAESSASRIRHQSATAHEGWWGGGGRDQEASVHTPHRAPTVHEGKQRTPAKDRIRDTRGALNDGDARNILNKKRQDATPSHSYNPWRNPFSCVVDA
jgi:hypothetical protein